MWECTVRYMQNGAVRDRVYPTADSTWATSILGDGEGLFTFKTNDAAMPLPRSPRDLFIPNALGIELRWGEFVAYFGKIENWSYDRDTATVTVSTIELANEWKWRMPYGVNNYASGDLSIPGRTESGAVARILARFMQWTPEWQYPIDLPADAPGEFTAYWEYWRKLRIDDLIQKVRERGFEVYLRPYATSTGETRFQARVARRITVGTSTFNLQAEKSPLGQVRYTVDGTQQLTGLQGLGNGRGQDQPVAWAGYGPYSIPIRDARRDFPDLTGEQLQRATAESFEADREPLVQWSVGEYTVGDGWTPAEAAVGRVWQVDSHGDPAIPDGRHMLRVIRASGSLGAVIKTEVQGA